MYEARLDSSNTIKASLSLLYRRQINAISRQYLIKLKILLARYTVRLIRKVKEESKA